MSKFVCDHPWTHFEVNNPNGCVTMCCDNNTVLGNVNQGTIEEIWNGAEFIEIRRQMREEGAHAICPHTCPVLNGGKGYQRLTWTNELAEGGEARANAETNDREFAQGLLTLKSLPRWMRFAYSYTCNLDCYHCYQREDATQNVKLPTAFMDQVRRLAKVFQVVFPFGGEPFLYKPVLDLLEEVDVDPGCRYFFVTNATLLTDRVFHLLRNRQLGMVAVSLDAATAQSFETLRKRGRTADWNDVIANLGKLQQLKREKDFVLTVSMTVNRVNHDEILDFVRLGLTYDADPIVALVTNPYQTTEFQKQFLAFQPAELKTMHTQIEAALLEVRARGFIEGTASLQTLRAHLRQHEQGDNSLAYYVIKRAARKGFHCLPHAAQSAIRGLVQRLRVWTLDRARAKG